MKAKEIMTSQSLCTCRPEATCQQAAQQMCQKDVGVLPVVDANNRVQGIITDRDICCKITAAGKNPATPVSQVMCTDVQCLQADSTLEQIEAVMQQHQIRRVPIVDANNRLQGIISIANLASACHKARQEGQLCTTLEAVCAPSQERELSSAT